MATERQSPDGILSQVNLSGALSAIQDDPDSPDGNWWTAPGSNNNTEAGVDFPTPTGNPTVGAGLQEFRAWVRKTNHSTDPTGRIELWENGSLIRAGSDGAVSSTSGQIISFTWNANEISTADGSLVQCKVIGTVGGGNPGNRASLEVGAIEWNVDYTAGATPKSSTETASISASETRVLASTSARSETASTSATETPSVSGTATSAETASVSASETPKPQVNQPPSSDTGSLSVVETAAVSVVLTSSDAASVSSAESQDSLVAFSSSDMVSVSGSDSSGTIGSTISVAETASVVAMEAPSSFGDPVSAETASVSVTESPSVVVILSSAETASVSGSETSAVVPSGGGDPTGHIYYKGASGGVVRLVIPTAIDPAAVTFQVESDGSWYDLYEEDGTEVQVASSSGSRAYRLSGVYWGPSTGMAIRSGTSASPVSQTEFYRAYLVGRPYATS